MCFVAPGPVHGVGLVDLPGRLWPANLQIPESEPSHCPGSTGEVSTSDMNTLLGTSIQYFSGCGCAGRVCEEPPRNKWAKMSFEPKTSSTY